MGRLKMRKRKRGDYPEEQNYPGDSGGDNYQRRGQNSNYDQSNYNQNNSYRQKPNSNYNKKPYYKNNNNRQNDQYDEYERKDQPYEIKNNNDYYNNNQYYDNSN